MISAPVAVAKSISIVMAGKNKTGMVKEITMLQLDPIKNALPALRQSLKEAGDSL